MKASYAWLKELSGVEASASEVGARLTKQGLEVEAIHELPELKETVLEIGVTPNRGDCLGHIGLARELALAFGKSFDSPKVKALSVSADPIQEPRASVKIEDAEGCPRYGAALVKGVKVGASPEWLVNRLQALGVRSVNNLVDISNLVMFEYGHPIHAFDYARLKDGAIVVRRARDGETIKTLDGVEHKLSAEDLVIADAEKPVALAGVMGGANSEISDATKDVLIECAYFDPRSVRRTARRFGMHTDASHRFERGVNPEQIGAVLARTCELIVQVAGGNAVNRAIEVIATPATRAEIPLRRARMNALLGVELPWDQASAQLRALGCEVISESENELRVKAPPARSDLHREADLIEELIRIQGYDQIPVALPRVRGSSHKPDPEFALVEQLRRAALGAGLHEAITYSFVSRDDLQKSASPEDAVPIENPLSEERSVMRTSLLPGLLQVAQHALRRQVSDLAIFEIGKVFSPGAGKDLPNEARHIGILLAGNPVRWYQGQKPVDFYDAKGAVEQILAPLFVHTTLDWAAQSDANAAPYLHPRKSAELSVAQLQIARVGELHPDVAERMSIDEPAVYAEIYIAQLLRALSRVGESYAQLPPRFPALTRDIAMEVEEQHQVGSITAAIQEAAKGAAESVAVFDVYRGKGIAAGKKSLAFRITYRDPSTTLRDEDVEKVHRAVVERIVHSFGASIR